MRPDAALCAISAICAQCGQSDHFALPTATKASDRAATHGAAVDRRRRAFRNSDGFGNHSANLDLNLLFHFVRNHCRATHLALFRDVSHYSDVAHPNFLGRNASCVRDLARVGLHHEPASGYGAVSHFGPANGRHVFIGLLNHLWLHHGDRNLLRDDLRDPMATNARRRSNTHAIARLATAANRRPTDG